MKKRITAFFFLSVGIWSFNAYGTNYLFPQANNYPYGIKPNCVSQEEMNQDCLNAFEDFIKNSVTSEGCPPGVAFRVHNGEGIAFAGSEAFDTYSEGIAWGMLLSVIMDNGSNNARTYFDGFNAYRKAFRNSIGLMGWHVDKNAVLKDSGIAVEADENMAMALILAHRKWGSRPDRNYGNDAKEIINALMNDCVQKPELFMKPGATWGGYKLIHPCNFDVCFYKEWEQFTGDPRWLKVQEESYSIFQKIYTRYPSGYLPHWCDYDGNKPTGQKDYFMDDTFEFDALQTAFKIPLDYLLYGDQIHSLAFSIPNSLSSSIRKSTNESVNRIGSGYDLNGNIVNLTYGNSAFIGAFGVASMVSPAHQQWCNSLYSSLRNQPTGGKWGYYKDIIRLFSLIIMSGNYPH
jgi:hypothetical protein